MITTTIDAIMRANASGAIGRLAAIELPLLEAMARVETLEGIERVVRMASAAIEQRKHADPASVVEEIEKAFAQEVTLPGTPIALDNNLKISALHLMHLIGCGLIQRPNVPPTKPVTD